MTDRETPSEKPTAHGYADQEVSNINDQYGWEGIERLTQHRRRFLLGDSHVVQSPT